MLRNFSALLLLTLMLSACQGGVENKEAKGMLQGVWYNADTNERSLYVKGDTIFYADPENVPSYFRIVDDSLEIYGANIDHYAIYRQAPHIFYFYNLNGELVKLRKGERAADTLRFVYKGRKPTIRKTVQRDSTVVCRGKKYKYSIAVAPGSDEVLKQTYTNDGIQVDNVYFDNTVSLTVKDEDKEIYSSQINKLEYAKIVPSSFLSQAVFADMDYKKADADGLHFTAVFAIPNEKLSYNVETIISPDGKLSVKNDE
ncbi:MAG: DUF4738 domain-containing protein [Prevotellaceae bacterium]|nr:DUF4738 domain-containing protein [Prevotellaceae bacterium]